MEDWRPVLDSIRTVEGVVTATPFALTQVVLTTSEDYAQPAQLYGVDVEALGDAATGIEERIRSGALSLGRDGVGASAPSGRLGAGRSDVHLPGRHPPRDVHREHPAGPLRRLPTQPCASSR